MDKMKMNGTGDFTYENDCNKFESHGDIFPREDPEIKPLVSPEQRYKSDLLTSAKKCFIFLERQSLIDCLEVDEDYIVSAGRDHDINVWDAVEGKHVRRLSGHHAPVTGLSLFDSKQSPFDKIIASSSEDGSIRIWSLYKGEELNKIETENVITCMGIMDKSLAVTGNHKGYMEVRHLRGELYTSIRAHEDPVDALEVSGNYACTATFEAPSCLKVWVIQFQEARCIYSIENRPDIEFSCLTIWNKEVVLGSSNQQKLLVINFQEDRVTPIDLKRHCGKVLRVKVWNEWIISCSQDSMQKTGVLLDVHRLRNYEHFGTFVSNVQTVKVIASIELYSTFKIVMGGSALEILSFEFNQTGEETNILASRLKSTPLLDNYYDENSTDSADDDFEDETSFDCDDKIGDTIQSNCDSVQVKQENEELDSVILPEKTEFSDCFENTVSTPLSNVDKYHANINKVIVTTEFTTSPKRTQVFTVLAAAKEKACSPHVEIVSPTRNIIEPRIALKKLTAELDKNNHQEELENHVKNTENEEENDIVIVKDNLDVTFTEDGAMDNVAEVIELECDGDPTEETEVRIIEDLELSTDVKETQTLPILQETAEMMIVKQEIHEKNIKFPLNIDKNSKKKNKKKEFQKTKTRKCRKCRIM